MNNQLKNEALHLYYEHFENEGDNHQNENMLLGAMAPGRVNLIGEHVDYQDGFVLPIAIQFQTIIIGKGYTVPVDEMNQNDVLCRVVSKQFSQDGIVNFYGRREYIQPIKEETNNSEDEEDNEQKENQTNDILWVKYIKGVTYQYLKRLNQGEGLSFDIAIVSNVPMGAGLSSSASLEVCFATFLDQIIAKPPSKKLKAQLCQQSDHEFLNIPCGIMDQLISVMGRRNQAVLLDCRNLDVKYFPLDNPNIAIFITNSNIKHSHAEGEYPKRVQECNRTVYVLKEQFPNINSLRDATMANITRVRESLNETEFRRARHVISEIQRTKLAAQALVVGDYNTFGALMYESHVSLRDDFEVSCEELDILVDAAMEVEGVYGSRMTGGGFGGCTVTLVEKNAIPMLKNHIVETYRNKTGRTCPCFVTSPGPGATILQVDHDNLDDYDNIKKNNNKNINEEDSNLLNIVGVGLMSLAALGVAFVAGNLIKKNRKK